MKLENIKEVKNQMAQQNSFKSAGDRVSNSFCIIPWVHLHTWPNGKVFPCCLANSDYPVGNLKDNTMEEIWNSPDMKNIRKQLLNGEKPMVCSRCYMQEEKGSASFRVSSNNQWSHHIDNALETTLEDGTNNNFKLNYWDFRFSNVCNFKCRMCGPELSSSWYDDQIKMFGSSTTPRALINANDISKEDMMIYVDRFINDVEEIYFAGGEPLIMEEHYKILEKLIAAGNTKCRIRYNTNFSFLKFKQWDVMELWKPFIAENPDNVRVFASLDGIGKGAEYSRKGTKWSLIESNIKKLHDAGMTMRTSTTVSIFNIFELPAFVDRMYELGVTLDNMQMNNVLTFPDYYCINLLPKELQIQAIANLEKHLDSIKHLQYAERIGEAYQTIVKYFDLPSIRPKEEIYKDLKRFTELKDKHRNESFIDTYPYYKEWYETGKIEKKWQKLI